MASRLGRERSSGSRSAMPSRCSKPVQRIWNFRKVQASVSRSSWKLTAAWFRSSSRVGMRKTNARARTCRGERRSFRWRTPRGAGRRSTPARSRAARRRPGGNCWPALRAGFGANSRVHAVGDGAPWIVGQVEEQFGDQGSYLIDFYHVCEYLSAAAEAIAPDAAARETWIEAQKDALRDGRLEMTLRSLVGHCEAPEVDDEQAPVRRCHRYLSSRKNQLNYRQALAEGLPIGSGEIESAHRYVAARR